MFKLNNVGKKLYFSVLAVFLVFAVSFIVFQQTREKQYKISTLTLKLANYNELLAGDLELSKTGGILLSDSVEVVDSVRVAEAKLEDFVQTHESPLHSICGSLPLLPVSLWACPQDLPRSVPAKPSDKAL